MPPPDLTEAPPRPSLARATAQGVAVLRRRQAWWATGASGLYGLVGLILIVLWSLVIGFSAFQKQRQIDEAQRELGYLGSAVTQHTESLFRTVETDLRVIDHWLQGNPGIDPLRNAGFNGLVDEIRKTSAGLVDPRMVSTSGRLHYLPSRDGAPLADVSDRPYYREALKLGAGKIYIGDPVLSRVTGKWGIPVSMRLSRPVGDMQVVFVAIELDRLQLFHERFRVQPGGAVVLMRRDGVVLSRTPFDARLIGRNLSDQPWFAQVSRDSRGTFHTDGALTDGQARLLNFEQLQSFPLIVVVSRGVEEVLAGYYERRSLVAVVLVCITLLGLFFTSRLYRAQQALRQFAHEAQQAAALLMASQNASPLGQFSTDESGQLVSVNDAWRQIHNLSGDAPVHEWQSVLTPEPRLAAQLESNGYLPEGEHALHHPGNRIVRLKVKRADIVVDAAVVGSSGTVEDVTERRASEKAQRMLADVFEVGTDIVVQSDLSGRFLYVNPAFRRFFGLAPDMPVDAISSEDILQPAFRERREREIRPVALKQGYWQGETLLADLQGREHVLSHLLIAHRTPEGVPQHFSGILRDITVEKQVERQLQLSEQRLRLITDNVPALIAEIDRDCVYRFVNRAYEDWLGIARSDMVGRTVEQAMGGEMYKVIGPYHVRALQGERVDYERAATFGGQTRWLHITLVPRFDDQGRSNGCYAIGFDITGNRKTETALRENEQRLRAITDNVPALISEVGADLRYRFVNHKYSQWMGLGNRVLVGQKVDDALPPHVMQQVLPKFEAALRGEQVEYERYITEVPGGRIVLFHLVPRRDAQTGAVTGFYTLGMDVTAARHAETALRQSEALMTSITDHMPMRVSYVDNQERYQFVNLAYERAFARPRQAWSGRTVREMLGEAAYQKIEPFVRRALQGESVSFDGELTTAEGYRSYRSEYIPQFVANDHSVVGFLCIITDTTGQTLEERRLIALSQRDPLTGLLNRAGFDIRLREALQHARDAQSYLAVMYLDVDRFKHVNDSLGHIVGDMLLQGFGGRMSKTLRATDTAARLGGDEFAILLEDIDSPRSAARVAENIVKAMQEPFILEDRSVLVTTSLGVAVHVGAAAAQPRDLMRRADEQLYAAKGAGRNCYRIDSDAAT